jgi:N-formylglutamate amidohydrolase
MDPTELGSNAAPAAADGESHAVTHSEPPFVLIEPLRRTAPLIFASPHSGRRYPPELLADARVSLISLRRSEDAYVDELFAGVAAHGACVLSGTVARAYVDLNRDPAELDPEMFDERPPPSPQSNSARVQAGLGAIPRISGDGQTIYRRKLALSEAERRISTVHRPYHALLQNLVAETSEQFGCAVLIDCHSMPNNARGAHAPDIVLGDRFGSCHPSVTSLVEATLAAKAIALRATRRLPAATRRNPTAALPRAFTPSRSRSIAAFMSMSARSNAPTATPACAAT